MPLLVAFSLLAAMTDIGETLARAVAVGRRRRGAAMAGGRTEPPPRQSII